MENLTEYDYIVCEFALCTFLTYLIETWISPGYAYEFKVVYVQPEKSQYFFTTTTYEVHTFKNKIKRKSLRVIFVYHFFFYICLFGATNFL